MTQRWPEWLQINDNLRDLSPYGAPQIDSPVRLNTNENPYNLNSTLQASIVAAISDNVSHLNRYPDRDAVALRDELASFINEISGTTMPTFGRQMVLMKSCRASLSPSKVQPWASNPPIRCIP
jgi:histidinol-phosphate/aromatic aminotransferase/cobyric acid decarboxylase-like protein